MLKVLFLNTPLGHFPSKKLVTFGKVESKVEQEEMVAVMEVEESKIDNLSYS